MDFYPLKFKPIYKEKIWGGRKIERLYGRRLPEGCLVGESWEVADHGADVSLVADGRLEGISLRELMQRWPREVLGPSISSRGLGRFPLLVKLIDASDRLSVQVHPEDDYAAAHEGSEWGKTEMWYVAQADPGSELICGLAEGVSPERFERAIRGGGLAECLRRVRVREGDVVFVPAGRLHAIGAGNLILEIQENSDVTYRVYDWDRLGADGKPRELHREKALEVTNFADRADPVVEKRWEEAGGIRFAPLVDCRYFRAVLFEARGRWRGPQAGERFRIISLVKGAGELCCGGGRARRPVRAGDNVLVPAALGACELVPGPAGCTFLQTEVP